MFVGFIWSTLSVIVLYLLQDIILTVFTSNPIVNELIISVYFLIAIFVFFDCLQSVASGIIRGLGNQGKASIITCVGYWCLGIPISLYSVYKLDKGMVGLWMGPSTAIIFNFTFYCVLIMLANWTQIMEDAKLAMERENRANA
mmetsp:Transcript_38176/g.36532  ORF Transcript_38176/g.36532 Transcript_38176/m.36532 type:complete len:143 (+) Transcript_38176:353-781(+)